LKLTEYYSRDEIKKNEMDRACGTYGGQKRSIQDFCGEIRSERDHMEDLSVDGRIILQWIFKKWDEGAWTGLIWLRIWTGSELL
jgi:hypothetical protein